MAAYLEEDAATRNDAALRLTADLSGRLETLRTALAQSEAKAERYRRDKNLVRIGDRLLVEQQLAAATTALNDSQVKFDRASARLKQIESAAQNPSALGAEMRAIRFAARADVTRARNEQQILSNTVAGLADKVTHARQSEIELREIAQEVDANRKLLESFETRSREAKEFGRIDTGNLRIVSMARAPERQRLAPKMAIFGGLGMFVGLLLGLAILAGVTLVNLLRSVGAPPPPARRPLPQSFMPIEVPVRYRFG